MKKDFFVIGDVHGKLDMMTRMLEHWDESTQQLVLLGDLVDRGQDSKSCLLLGKQLVEEHGAFYLLGNHEDMFLEYIDDNEKYGRYQRNGGDTTINSLLGRPLHHPVDVQKDKQLLLAQYGELIEFLKNRPLYVESERYIFAHAGVNLDLPDWHDSSRRDFVWIRDEFHNGRNHTHKTIVFGHTTTRSLFQQDQYTSNLWMSDQKIGIDGGAVYGGYLNSILLNDDGILQHLSKKQWAVCGRIKRSVCYSSNFPVQ